MELTLCHDCVQPFFDDKNYIIAQFLTDPCDNECFICGRHGCNYDIEKRALNERVGIDCTTSTG